MSGELCLNAARKYRQAQESFAADMAQDAIDKTTSSSPKRLRRCVDAGGALRTYAEMDYSMILAMKKNYTFLLIILCKIGNMA